MKIHCKTARAGANQALRAQSDRERELDIQRATMRARARERKKELRV
jgi:hypothetical protein